MGVSTALAFVLRAGRQAKQALALPAVLLTGGGYGSESALQIAASLRLMARLGAEG
jgi:hypothetical protein